MFARVERENLAAQPAEVESGSFGLCMNHHLLSMMSGGTPIHDHWGKLRDH